MPPAPKMRDCSLLFAAAPSVTSSESVVNSITKGRIWAEIEQKNAFRSDTVHM